MKKTLIVALVIILVSAIALVATSIVIGSFAQTKTTEESAQNAESIIAYVEEQWSDYTPAYDPATNVLTLTKEFKLTYETACARGGSVFEGVLAPETYQQDAANIALDIIAHCGLSSLSVKLCYLSSDGKPIFTADSGGEIWTCWKTNEP